MPVSEKQKGYRDKYDKENFQYITFKAKKGAKERIVEAATASGQSTNGFIRASLNEAVERATGRPMEAVERDDMKGAE
jgi:predicted HicB family RNase H-like nuclease